MKCANYVKLIPRVIKLYTHMQPFISIICKQQQTASDNKNLYNVFVPITCLWWVLSQLNLVH